jgi:tetratricopeptide (TPR) repeat protein
MTVVIANALRAFPQKGEGSYAQRVEVNWQAVVERETARYADGERRLPAEPERKENQLVRMAMAAGGAGLALLMLGRSEEAASWLGRSAERYRESWKGAPPGSWGRLIGALKARLLAGDTEGAVRDARWALAQGPESSESPIGRYAATLAQLVLEEDGKAAVLAEDLQKAETFPRDVADALAALATVDAGRYADAVRSVLASFETRDEYLEDVPVADTVLVLEALAEPRGLAIRPASTLLP